MKYIKRDSYLNQLIRFSKTQDIKVITGVRRSGKSVLLEMFKEYLLKHEDNINIVSINLQELEYDYLLDYHFLHQYVMEHYAEGKYNVLMIDEIQLCSKFELVINSLHTKNIYDIYITGSNAFLLSSDLATLFTGRTMQVKVFPFSYKEYTDCVGKSKENLLDEYVVYGGLPGVYAYADSTGKTSYIKDLYETILIRDLVQKYHIQNVRDFNAIAEYLMDNIGNISSMNSMEKSLKSEKFDVTRKTLSNYVNYLKNAFMFYEVKRYDLKGKKYLETLTKFYLCDTGMCYAVNGTRNMDYGRAYENVVAIELLRRGYDVYIGKLYQKEIDFVAKKSRELLYIQVSDSISEQSTFEREVSPLMQIKDNYPKLLLARTKHPKYDYNGIEIIDLEEWLLK